MLSGELKAFLRERGAALVGFGDMRGVPGCGWPVGISAALPVPSYIVRGIAQGPTLAYWETYHRLNGELDALGEAAEAFLRKRGFRAEALTTKRVVYQDATHTALPHKTAATRAGLGWIGKCALLVTPEYGSAVRLTTILTDAPLACAEPITASRCGGCTLCRDACPAGAVSGRNWSADMPRGAFFDAPACREKAAELARELIGKDQRLCGRCFVVCPYTQKRLRREEKEKSV